MVCNFHYFLTFFKVILQFQAAGAATTPPHLNADRPRSDLRGGSVLRGVLLGQTVDVR